MDLARARYELAEARLEMIQADEEFADGSQAGSAGRRLEDVQSEVGSTTDLPSTLPTDGALRAPPTLLDEQPFDGVFVLNASSVSTPSIYDVFSKDRGCTLLMIFWYPTYLGLMRVHSQRKLESRPLPCLT